MTEPAWTHLLLPADPLGRLLFRAARLFAACGGLMMVMVVLVSVANIGSRWLLGSALPGDFELVQMACAIAVPAFLPWGQMRGSHVCVDFFTARLRCRFRQGLESAGALLLAVAAAMLTWRMIAGTVDMYASGEMSMLLGIPTWLIYLMMLPSFALFSLTGLYTAWRAWQKDPA